MRLSYTIAKMLIFGKFLVFTQDTAIDYNHIILENEITNEAAAKSELRKYSGRSHSSIVNRICKDYKCLKDTSSIDICVNGLYGRFQKRYLD